MLSLKVQNKYGEELELTGDPAYVLTSVDGIDPPDAVINHTHNAGTDGSVFNSSYMSTRTITVTLAINYPAEENRLKLYRYLKTKDPVRVTVETELRVVYIDGYVQALQIGYFDKKQVAQATIFCPQPHFNGLDIQVQPFSTVQSAFEFEFDIEEAGIPFSEIVLDLEKAIINHGDLETGALITIYATGPLKNPKIYNVSSDEHMIFEVDMDDGDELIINTRLGEKSIKLISQGATTSMIGALQRGSTWFSMAAGDNVFTVTADENPQNMIVEFECIDQYEGV